MANSRLTRKRLDDPIARQVLVALTSDAMQGGPRRGGSCIHPDWRMRHGLPLDDERDPMPSLVYAVVVGSDWPDGQAMQSWHESVHAAAAEAWRVAQEFGVADVERWYKRDLSGNAAGVEVTLARFCRMCNDADY